MRTYYFNVKDGVTVRDRRGLEFPTAGGAIEHCKELGRRLRGDARLPNDPTFNLCDRRVWYGNSPRESLQWVGDPTGRKQDVTREIVRPVDLAGDELPSSLEAFCRPTPRLRAAPL
jgi:hypothetical protein